MRGRLIVGLDVDDAAAARRIVRRLGSAVATGADVFLDLKFHDIPNTVAAAGVEAARLGVRFFNIHTAGGLAMMERTVADVDRVCRAERLRRPKILGVTVLTSLGDADLRLVGVESEAAAQVIRLAKLAQRAGLDGVIASAQEVAASEGLRARFLVVTPGCVLRHGARRPASVMTPAGALAAGVAPVVVSRPVLAAPDPVAAANTS